MLLNWPALQRFSLLWLWLSDIFWRPPGQKKLEKTFSLFYSRKRKCLLGCGNRTRKKAGQSQSGIANYYYYSRSRIFLISVIE